MRAFCTFVKSFQVAVLLTIFLWTGLGHAAGNISDTEKFAWSENSSWLNFNPTHGGVTVHETYLSGYAWGEVIGWVKLGSAAGGPYTNSDTTDWGVNRDAGGNLSGYAWSEAAGWINFNPTHSQVTINLLDKNFNGYAWSENVGWINFRNASLAYGVQTTFDQCPGGMINLAVFATDLGRIDCISTGGCAGDGDGDGDVDGLDLLSVISCQ
jgi:hypothetical protein